MDHGAKINLSSQDCRRIKQNALEGRPYIDRVSLGLCLELLLLRQRSPDGDLVLLEMDALEGLAPSSTKRPASQFKCPPLSPFWHKHMSGAKYITKNLDVHWGISSGGNRRFQKMADRIAYEYGESTDAWINHYIDEFVVKAFFNRLNSKSGLTGDWLIFAKHNNQNYYLGFTEHPIGREFDQPLYEYLKKVSAADFPFLFS